MSKRTNPKNKKNNVRQLTGKQREFAKQYAQTLNATQSAKAVYKVSNDKVASVIGTENLVKPSVNNEIKAIMERQGLNGTFITSKLQSLINKGTDTTSIDKTTPREALRALELASKMMGYLDRHDTRATLVVRAELEKQTPNQLKDKLIKLREEEEKYLNTD